MAEALAGVRVLEAGAGAALAYAGKLFADFGAVVLKLDSPDELDRAWPSVHGRSAVQGWLNANKRLVRGEVAGLAPGCHVLLDARAEATEALPPHLVHIRISWFGESGPYRDFAATDVTCRALAGVFACTGPAEGPPALLGGIAGEALGGIAAFIAAAAALWGGGGRRWEASVHEANIAVAEYQAAQAVTNPEVERRLGINRFAPTCPLGVYRCREGWLGVTVVTPAQWRSFCEMVGLEELGRDPSLVVGLERLRHADRLDALLAERLRARTARDWFEEALARRLPFAVVPEMAALLDTPTHRARGAFQRIAMGGATFEGPTVPQRLTRTPPRAAGTAPLAAEAAPALPELSGTPARSPLPLQGLRVLDLSMGWAGPLCTRTLGDLGAEVIKVEAIQYPDWWRGVDPRPAFFEERRYEKDVRFAFQNRNKRGITLDLARPAGAALLKRLVAVSDAVVENYAREVLPKLGLDYPVLRRSRPDLVMLSMPAFGAEGPWRDARAYGSTLEHASGLPTVSGPADAPPTTNQLAYGDPVGGLNAAAALLVALLHRRNAGEGQHVDLAQVECMFPLVAPWIIAQSALGDPGPRLGNRHPAHVPHGAFPCAAEGWIAVAVTDDAAWRRLCAALGRPDLSALDAAARRAREEELEGLLAAWTRGRTAEEAMAALQGARVAAGAVRWPTELRHDAHLAARGFWQRAEREHLGPHTLPSAPFRPAGGPPLPVRRAAPTLGQENAAVLAELLGLGAAAIAALEAEGIIGTEAVPVAARRPRAPSAEQKEQPMTPRRTLLAAGLAAPAVARAQGGWPDRPIRLIYPFAPGAGDFLARAIGERMREAVGQPFVVDNRPGANTMIGAEAAARAPKDGYTLGWVATSTMSLNPNFYPNIAYRLEDFAPLCLVYRAPVAFAAAAELPVRDVGTALEHIRRHPGLGVGTVGNGSSPHLTMEWMMALTGLRLENVAYRGEAAILADLMSGRIPFYAGSTNSLLPHLPSGKLRVLATSAPERLPVIPDVPTFAEAVHRDLVQRYWHGIMAPAGTPAPIVARLAEAIAEVVRSEYLRGRATPDMTLDPLMLDDFARLVREEQALYGRLIRERNITVG